jgi:phosphoribosylaminoimidazole-succinocarboxamide synthase
MTALYATSIASLPLLAKGKVRDTYIIDDKTLLMMTTDRLSAFDVVMNEPITDKGRVLNQPLKSRGAASSSNA